MASDETTKMNLQNDITVNGRTFKAGMNVEVPKEQADNLAEIDYTHQKYKDNLMKKNKYEVNAGTIGAGGGAE